LDIYWILKESDKFFALMNSQFDLKKEREKEREHWLKRFFMGHKSVDFDVLEPLIIMSYVKVWLKDIYSLTCIRNKSF
jgi:hypothetical protein